MQALFARCDELAVRGVSCSLEVRRLPLRSALSIVASGKYEDALGKYEDAPRVTYFARYMTVAIARVDGAVKEE